MHVETILTCHGHDHDHQGGCPHKEAAFALGLTLKLADFCCEPPVGYTREQFLQAGFQISVWPLSPLSHFTINHSMINCHHRYDSIQSTVAAIVDSHKRGTIWVGDWAIWADADMDENVRPSMSNVVEPRMGWFSEICRPFGPTKDWISFQLAIIVTR